MTGADVSFATLDYDHGERFQTLRRELGIESFGINLILLEPRQRDRIHAHEHQEEAYLVLAGELTLIVEGTPHVLGRDRLARVPAKVRHQLVNAGSERLVALALGGSGQHVGRDGHAWASWEEGGSGQAPLAIPLPEDLPGP